MQSDTCTEWVVCSTARSISSPSLFPLSLQLCWLIHLHLQNTALALYNIAHLSFLCAADRGPASRVGAFAALQAGDREARPQPQLFFWAGGLQQQDQGGGARARGQEAQAGNDESLCSNTFCCA